MGLADSIGIEEIQRGWSEQSWELGSVRKLKSLCRFNCALLFVIWFICLD